VTGGAQRLTCVVCALREEGATAKLRRMDVAARRGVGVVAGSSRKRTGVRRAARRELPERLAAVLLGVATCTRTGPCTSCVATSACASSRLWCVATCRGPAMRATEGRGHGGVSRSRRWTRAPWRASGTRPLPLRRSARRIRPIGGYQLRVGMGHGRAAGSSVAAAQPGHPSAAKIWPITSRSSSRSSEAARSR